MKESKLVLTPVNILSLPLEIVREIGNLLPQNMKSLTLVCSWFNRALESDVLSTLVIYITGSTVMQSNRQLRVLALQKTRATLLARTLKIKCLSPSLGAVSRRRLFDGQEISRAVAKCQVYLGTLAMKWYLGQAISSLKNVECASWVLSSDDPPWTQAIVISALSSLPHLQEFHINITGGLYLPQLDHLSGLKKIKVSLTCNPDESGYARIFSLEGLATLIASSPQLAHLEVNSRSAWRSPITLHGLLKNVPQDVPLQLTHLTLHGIFAHLDSQTLSHLRSLVYLNLDRLYSTLPTSNPHHAPQMMETASTAGVYAILEREKIHLKHVVIGCMLNDVILDYLGSYSGLETLDLRSPSGYSANAAEVSDTFSRKFYTSVLPKHINSLRVLKIRPAYEGGWCYNLDSVYPVLAQCSKLRSLSIALNSVPSINHRMVGSETLLHYCDPGSDHFDDEVCSLINLSHSGMADLTQIRIFPADLNAAHRSILVATNPHRSRVMECISRCVADFRPEDGKHSNGIFPDIWVDQWKFYQYQRLDDGLEWGYKLSYARPRLA